MFKRYINNRINNRINDFKNCVNKINIIFNNKYNLY